MFNVNVTVSKLGNAPQKRASIKTLEQALTLTHRKKRNYIIRKPAKKKARYLLNIKDIYLEMGSKQKLALKSPYGSPVCTPSSLS